MTWRARLTFLALFSTSAACSDDGLSPQDSTSGLASGADDGTGGSAGDPSGVTSADGTGGGGTGDDGADDGSSGSDEGGARGDGYCPGAEPWPKDVTICLTQADCPEFYTCDPALPTGPQCGACSVPDQMCQSDADCTRLGMVCVPYQLPCPCEPGVLGCDAPCQETGCEEGEECQPDGHCLAIPCEGEWACDARTEVCDPAAPTADAHGCAPTPCDDGWACDVGWICMPGEVGGDPHGCLPVHCEEPGGVTCGDNFDCDAAVPGSGCAVTQCTTSADCDCGSCVEGQCRPTPGVCVSPPPP